MKYLKRVFCKQRQSLPFKVLGRETEGLAAATMHGPLCLQLCCCWAHSSGSIFPGPASSITIIWAKSLCPENDSVSGWWIFTSDFWYDFALGFFSSSISSSVMKNKLPTRKQCTKFRPRGQKYFKKQGFKENAIHPERLVRNRQLKGWPCPITPNLDSVHI